MAKIRHCKGCGQPMEGNASDGYTCVSGCGIWSYNKRNGWYTPYNYDDTYEDYDIMGSIFDDDDDFISPNNF